MAKTPANPVASTAIHPKQELQELAGSLVTKVNSQRHAGAKIEVLADMLGKLISLIVAFNTDSENRDKSLQDNLFMTKEFLMTGIKSIETGVNHTNDKISDVRSDFNKDITASSDR